MEERPAKKRVRSSLACQRCKYRKQRCDNQSPSCSNCTYAGEDCVYGFTRMYPAEYVKSLELRVAELEQTACSSAPTIATQTRSQKDTHRRNTQPIAVDSVDSTSTANPELTPEEVDSDLENATGVVALSPDTFLGTSSGFPLATLLRTAVSNSGDPSQIGHSVLKGLVNPAPDSANVFYGNPRHDRAQVPSIKADVSADKIGEKLIDAYYTKVHPKHPFLSRKRVNALHQARNTLMPASKQPNSVGREDKCNYAVLHLVYAIGARYLQLTNDYDHPSPAENYMKALDDADAIFSVRSLDSLEAMLLFTIYQLRSPSGPGVWWIIGTTMRYCLDCGLHRRASNLPAVLDQRRKRIFWTAYMLERSIARTMGRPYSVSDREIDVDLPANIDDALDTEEEVVDAIAESALEPAPVTPLTAAIHIFQIQRIESRITRVVCRVDKPVTSINPDKITELKSQLEDWKANIPKVQDPRNKEKHPYVTIYYHLTQYHKAIVLLFLPFLPFLTPSHRDFRQIAHSAGQICQLSKRLHDDQTYVSFSLLALHANFVAGLVLVYCFCKYPAIFDPTFSSDIRACSAMLYIIAERWPQARKVCGAFDRLVTATVERELNIPGRSKKPGPMAAWNQNGTNYTPTQGVDANVSNISNDGLWESFEAVLEGNQMNTEIWTFDNIFNIMDYPSPSVV